MRHITKENEPPELVRWKRKNPGKRYKDLSEVERQAIRRECVREQYGLCAFCCTRITASGRDAHNAHVQSQTDSPQRSLDWTNIVASCNNGETCGSSQGHATPPLSPLMPECETELCFHLSGKVTGETPRARESIELFQLDCDQLRNKRKKAISDFLYINEYYPPEEDPLSWDAEIWRAIITQCLTPDENNELAPFAPALAGIGRRLFPSQVYSEDERKHHDQPPAYPEL